MTNGPKSGPEVSIQLPETKMDFDSGPVSVTLQRPESQRSVLAHRKADLIHCMVRLICVLTSITAISVMTSAKQAGTLDLYGFSIPLFSKWSFSDSFEYLVGMSAAVAVYSLVQSIINAFKILRKSPIIASRNHAWLIFVADQIFGYAMMSAGSAASGVTNLNRTGIHHSALPNFCKPLRVFCDRVAVSIAFAFFSCFLLAVSVVLDVIWLSMYY
ncbi:CASP-like protein 3A1 [Striga hermonthica]|uniref:CASP-like protein n=1 Tax=Striga hermonthica TaxID=68872 RepID=A0A9N7RN77_STRHE|nr:CASP-like protein 3A1 [Striga hermonthica]